MGKGGVDYRKKNGHEKEKRPHGNYPTQKKQKEALTTGWVWFAQHAVGCLFAKLCDK